MANQHVPEPVQEAERGVTEAGVSQPSWARLKKLALRGSVFELAAHVVSITLRLAGNVVLSRLLFPKAFGLSGEVSFVLFGLVMLSDVGIRPIVIRSPNGDDPEFLNTAFTVQIVRGLITTAAGMVLSYPVARWWFREPELPALLLVACLQQIISGLNSTSVLTLRRHMRLGLVNLLDIAQQVVSLGVMVTWALVHPSVWALVAGSLAGTLFYAVASHCLPVGYHNRLGWKREAVDELVGFGRWIFGSSAITFFASQGDRALVGRLLGATQLGVYQIGAELAGTSGQAVGRLVNGVIFPLLSSKASDRDTKELRHLYYKSRLPLDAISQGSLGLLCGVGGWLVHLIWDPRYWDAGWIVRILCIQAATNCLLQPVESCWIALGQPRYSLQRSAVRGITVWILLPLGYWLGGVHGLVWSIALTELPCLLVLWLPFYRRGLLRIERELLAIGMFLVSLAIGATLSRILPEWHLIRHH